MTGLLDHALRRVRRLVRSRVEARRTDERGYVAVLVALLLASGGFLACAALSVDTSRWTVEIARVQQAADAAALAGVPFLPYDMPSAKARALQVAALNGYTNGTNGVVVTVAQGRLASQLSVTVSSPVHNAFGAAIGSPTATIARSAVADFTGAAPMGSPCNTFGNEPAAGDGTSSPSPRGTSAQGPMPFDNCKWSPQFWAQVEGPQTGKVQGDRYQTVGCEASGVDGCSGLVNTEYDPFGHVFIVKVQAAAVGQPIDLQLYDPEFANTGQSCSILPSAATAATDYARITALNPWDSKTDGLNRYTADGTTSSSYCTGDYFPTSTTFRTAPTPLTTSFVLRHAVDSLDPTAAPVQTSTSGAACIKQYGSYTTAFSSGGYADFSTATFASGKAGYNAGLSELFHNWTSLCTFVPDTAGEYYLQVRSNVSMGGSSTGNAYVTSGNPAAAAATGNVTAGAGLNSFAVRAVTTAGLQQQVAVSGYDHMPIFINSDNASATFNLIRVLPGSAGQMVSFSYFDAGDAQSSGSVTVLPPTDATGSILTLPFGSLGCTAAGGSALGALGAIVSKLVCSAPLLQGSGGTSQNNGKTETITIPIPTDYACSYTSLGGCWYRVRVSFGSGSVHDATTWDATVLSDPVRLVQ